MTEVSKDRCLEKKKKKKKKIEKGISFCEIEFEMNYFKTTKRVEYLANPA